MTFAQAVIQMRQAQKDHERVRSQDTLTKKREAEEEVDNQIRKNLDPEPQMNGKLAHAVFDGPVLVRPFPWSREEFEQPNYTEPKA